MIILLKYALINIIYFLFIYSYNVETRRKKVFIYFFIIYSTFSRNAQHIAKMYCERTQYLGYFFQKLSKLSYPEDVSDNYVFPLVRSVGCIVTKTTQSPFILSQHSPDIYCTVYMGQLYTHISTLHILTEHIATLHILTVHISTLHIYIC